MLRKQYHKYPFDEESRFTYQHSEGQRHILGARSQVTKAKGITDSICELSGWDATPQPALIGSQC